MTSTFLVYHVLALEQKGPLQRHIIQLVKASRLGEMSSTNVTFEKQHVVICLGLPQLCYKFGWLPAHMCQRLLMQAPKSLPTLSNNTDQCAMVHIM